jgi:hypothetical protein
VPEHGSPSGDLCLSPEVLPLPPLMVFLEASLQAPGGAQQNSPTAMGEDPSLTQASPRRNQQARLCGERTLSPTVLLGQAPFYSDLRQQPYRASRGLRNWGDRWP